MAAFSKGNTDNLMIVGNMEERPMKKATGLLCFLLILVLAAGALAAPGDAVLFTEEQRTQMGIQMSSNPAMAAVGDTVYTLWGAEIYAFTVGQENPVRMASGLEPGYYSNYEEAVAAVGDKADTLIANLVSDGTTLYGLNRLNGKLFPLTFQDEKAVLGTPVQLDWSKMEEKQDTYTYVRDVYRLCFVGNKLYAMIRNNEDWNKPEFAAFDMATGAKQVFDASFVQDIAPYKDGKLLVKVYDMEKAYQEGQKEPPKPTVAVFDPADGSLKEVGPFGDANVSGMVYQPETDTLYYTTSSKLMAMKALGAATQAAFVPLDYADDTASAAILSGGLYAINTWYGLIVRNTDPQYMPTSTLAVYGGWMDQGTMAFSLEYPQVPVTFNSNVYFEDAQTLAQAMVSGDNSFDVYNFDISYQDFKGLMDKGYCMDLSGSPELTAELGKMYPFLQSAVQKDGKFYALPTMMYGNGLSISPKVWEENGLTDKMPGSFLELIDFMNWWVDEGQNQYPNVQLMQGVGDYGETMFQMALDLYVHQSQAKNEDLSFDTPLFRKVMEALEGLKTKELNDMLPGEMDMAGGMSRAAAIKMKMARDGGGMGDALFMNYGDWLNVQGGKSSLEYSKPLMLPLEEGETVHIPVYVQGLFINPNTKNPEMAVKYVENALKHMDPAQHIMMFPDDNEPVPQANFEQTVQQWNDELEKANKRLETAKPEEKKDIESLVQSYEDLIANKDLYYWQVAAENITQYREVAPLCYVAMPNVLDYRAKDGTSEIMTLVDRYRQKQMSLDQFIQEVDQKIRMILLERQ
jgi:hypothetical protein